VARKKKTPEPKDQTETSETVVDDQDASTEQGDVAPQDATSDDAGSDGAAQAIVEAAEPAEAEPATAESATRETDDVKDTAPEETPPVAPDAEPVSDTQDGSVPPIVHDDHVGEHGSFPTWVKVVIIMVFGALLALWAGPRLADNLPSGMAPVARFLSPGSVRQAAEFEARLAKLESAAPAALDESEIQSVVSDIVARLVDSAVLDGVGAGTASMKSDMDSLRDALAAIDAADLTARLAAAETRLQGLDAQIATLSSEVTESIATRLAEQGEMSAEQAATYMAIIERLKAEIQQIAALQGAIDHKVDELAATNARLTEEASEIAQQAEEQTRQIATAAQISAALKDIQKALEDGSGFRPALEALTGTAQMDMAALDAIADAGVTPLTALQEAFPPLAHDALRASMRAVDGGVVGSSISFVKSHFATRSLTFQAKAPTRCCRGLMRPLGPAIWTRCSPRPKVLMTRPALRWRTGCHTLARWPLHNRTWPTCRRIFQACNPRTYPCSGL
jgi:hypothetical protein